jgi:hypothetical protein
MNTFKKDLEQSRIYELELIKHLKDVDRFEQAPDDIAFYDYDIKIYKTDETIETHEVKCDKYCNGYNGFSSGNIAIEYQQFREGKIKKTGISKSKAKYYSIFCLDSLDGYELFIIERKKLKQMINNQEFIANKKTSDESFFVLFKKSQIKNNSVLYKYIIQ